MMSDRYSHLNVINIGVFPLAKNGQSQVSLHLMKQVKQTTRCGIHMTTFH